MYERVEGILRENEKILRRCVSLERAKALVPTLITDLNSDRIEILKQTQSYTICKLRNVANSVYLIRSYLSEEEITQLSSEILTDLIDSPPHANNLNEKNQRAESGMWEEYLNSDIARKRLKKLRWSCVGYHYNWGARTYDKSNKSYFPSSFSDIYNRTLRIIRDVSTTSDLLEGNPQSAIINFYHAHRVSDRLGGHRDDVESTDQTPLVSISLGLPGLFLIDSEAILLNSGDAVVMIGEARQSLHAVPCILGNARREHQQATQFSRFLCNTRISISIRQVY